MYNNMFWFFELYVQMIDRSVLNHVEKNDILYVINL